MATQCWIHAHPVTTPWLQPAMRALRGLPDLQLRLLSAWPEAGQDRPTAEPDVVVLDAANVADSCRALQALRASHGLCRAVVVTPTLEPASLQQLARAGADDFIAIPVRAEELAIRVQRTLGWQGCTCPPDQPRTAGFFGAPRSSLTGRATSLREGGLGASCARGTGTSNGASQLLSEASATKRSRSVARTWPDSGLCNGSFSSRRMTTLSSAPGTRGFTIDGGTGTTCAIERISANSSSPGGNGALPVSTS